MAKSVKIKICHLYSNLMDTYGDKGNIITITKRCEWRGISAEVEPISIGDKLQEGYFDIFFFGGGQDRAQFLVGPDLKSKAKTLKAEVEKGVPLLSICGGYQLLQKYFKTKTGETIDGIGLFDAYTVGSDNRMIQNLLININNNLQAQINSIYQSTNQPNYQTTQLIGFENHSGKTFLEEGLEPLGTVETGAGNNGKDKTEGAIYKNAIGCYLHGSLLPKNPHLADWLITKALERKYGDFKLNPLDDDVEWQAHTSAVKRARAQS